MTKEEVKVLVPFMLVCVISWWLSIGMLEVICNRDIEKDKDVDWSFLLPCLGFGS